MNVADRVQRSVQLLLPELQEALHLGKIRGQIVLLPEVALQQGRVVIPKSVTPSRIAANLDLFGFELSVAELASIDALDSEGRTGPHPETFNG